MDLKRYLHDPKVRFVLYAVVGFLAAMIGKSLGHPQAVHTPAEKIAELERIGFPPRILIAIALWLIPGIYWEIAARNKTAVKEPMRTRSVHLALTAAAQLLLILPVPGLRARFLPLSMPVWVAGLAIEALAVALTVWARRVLGKNWSGAIATNVDHELIRRGPYRNVRHPIYTGILGTYLGVTIVSGEIHALIGLVLCLIAYARKIRMEEAHLRQAFGPAYADYAQHSWRLVPRVF
jgi:protein-S-isoprenylcysteine O-methyltransferase Ste14